MAELVDARVSKTRSLWECRFDSGSGHISVSQGSSNGHRVYLHLAFTGFSEVPCLSHG